MFTYETNFSLKKKSFTMRNLKFLQRFYPGIMPFGMFIVSMAQCFLEKPVHYNIHKIVLFETPLIQKNPF